MGRSCFQGCVAAVLAALLTACASSADLGEADPASSAASAASLWISNITLVDPATGQIVPSANVAIRGQTIRAVLPIDSAPDENVRRIDGTGKFLIPGLWDMHVHIADTGYLEQFVANGVLGVRDMGGGLDVAGNGCESLRLDRLKTLRMEVQSDSRIGPDMVLSGPALSGSGWPTSLPARTPAEAVASIALLSAQGADFVKVYEKIPVEAYLALAAEALDQQGRVGERLGLVDQGVELLVVPRHRQVEAA